VFHRLRLVQLLELPEGIGPHVDDVHLEAAPSLNELLLVTWDHACQMETDEEARREYSYSEKGVEGLGWTPAPGAFQHCALASLAVFGFPVRGLPREVCQARHGGGGEPGTSVSVWKSGVPRVER
jgi:hypothetical protein